MPSPFPGMDPWLEYHWGDVHARFVPLAAMQIQPRLPSDLRARIEERVAVEGEGDSGFLVPDIRVVERPREPLSYAGAPAGVAVFEPIVSRIPREDITERFIEIREFRGGPLIAVIELLSPTNKSGAGKVKYGLKRRELAAAGVTLVEIDLIRQGELPWYAAAGWYTDEEPYHVVIRPGWDTSELWIVPFSLRQPLPAFRIPLRSPDETVVLELAPIMNLIYETGCYEDTDYSERPPGPPFSVEDQEWVDTLLRQTGRIEQN
ncbi:MAG: DUF4058 family protein [Planctomycetaceae bacterium]